MKLTPENQKDFDALPVALRRLLKAELAAGNEIVEVGHGFPAAPVGAYFKLAKPVSARRRKSGRTIQFYDRNSSSYSGEFTDAKRHFFVLEPPHPPEPEPDMDAIRAAIKAKQQASDERLYAAQRSAKNQRRKTAVEPEVFEISPAPAAVPAPKAQTAVERFRQSMTMDYEKWHDGIGYDLSIIQNATPEELVEIENLLVSRSVDDWRDVEALAALDSPRARVLLKKAHKNGKPAVRVAVTDHAPNLFSKDERIQSLVRALEVSEVYGGLTQALLQVEEFHPPQIIDALFRGVLARKGDTAVHFAAMLMFLHGKADSSFDWGQRPFFLKFHTELESERIAMFRELCGKCGVQPDPYLAAG